MDTGNGFNLERGRSQFGEGAEWHFKRGCHQMDHPANMLHSRMYMEKMEPSNSEMKGMSPCSCHGCNMSRHQKMFDEPMWMQQEQWCYQSKEFLAKPPSCAEGSPALCFSVRTPVRRDGGDRSLYCSPPRMCMGGARGSALGGASMRPMFLTSENQMTLHKWFLIPVKEPENSSGGSPVAVGGFVRYGYDTEFRKTSPIVERTDKGRLKTSDGLDVRLLGCIDEEATTANGFTTQLAQFFFTGFPATWKKLLDEERTKKLEDERLTSAHRVDKPSSPGCIGTKDSADLFTTPQATADSTLHGDDGPLHEFEQPVCPETAKPSTPRDQEVADEEDQSNQPCRDEVSTPINENQVEGVPVHTAKPGIRRRSGKRLPTRSSKRLKRLRGKDRSQEPDAETSDRANKEGEQISLECRQMNPPVPVDENGTTETEPVPAIEVDNNNQHSGKDVGKRKSNAKEKKNSEQESDGSNELRDRVSADKPEREVAQVDVVLATEVVSPVSAEAVAEPALARDVVEPVSQDLVEAVAELSVLEHEVDVQEATAEINQQQTTTASAGRKRSRGRAAPKTGKKRRKTAGKKTVEVVEEASNRKEKDEVEAAAQTERNSISPEAPADDNRKPTSKRKARKRGVCREENQLLSVPVVEVVDSDDAQPANDVEKQVVQSRQLDDSVVEDKPKTRKACGRSKRSALPPPLPASRVEKSDVIEAFGLKTSRSGRLLVPPLAFWRNQTAARDRDGGIIAIMDGFKEPPSDTGYYNFKPPTEKKRLQEKLCATAVDSLMKASDKGKKKVRGSK